VKPVDDRVALSGSGVIGRQENPEIARFPEDLAELDAIFNGRLGAHCGQDGQGNGKSAEKER